MDCKKIETRFIAYLEQTVSQKEQAEMNRHFDACVKCSQKLEFIKSTMQTLDAVKTAEVKPYLYSRVQAKIEMESHTRIRPLYATLAMAAVLVVGLIFGSLISKFTLHPKSNVNYAVSELFNDDQIELVEFNYLMDR